MIERVIAGLKLPPDCLHRESSVTAAQCYYGCQLLPSAPRCIKCRVVLYRVIPNIRNAVYCPSRFDSRPIKRYSCGLVGKIVG